MTQRDEFDTPGDDIKVADYEGHLILFTPIEYIKVVPTIHGDKDVVDTDMVVLTADGGPEEFQGVRVFQSALVGSLKRKIDGGRKLLGVLGKGEAKRGQSAPYVLHGPTDEQKQIARDYLAGRTVAAALPAKDPHDPFAV